MPASYPGAVVVFPTRSNGQVIDASHIDAVQDEVTAIETGLINGTAPLNSSGSTVATLQVLGNSTMTGHVLMSSNLRVAGQSTVVGHGSFGAARYSGGFLSLSASAEP